jgi:hypothetical protein
MALIYSFTLATGMVRKVRRPLISSMAYLYVCLWTDVVAYTPKRKGPKG